MNRTIMALCLVGVFGWATSAFAQTGPGRTAAQTATAGNGGALTYLEIQAGSIDRDTQFAALEHIRQLVSEGPLPTSDQTFVYRSLSELAYSGTIDPTISGMTVVNSYPDIRMYACRLLGNLGGERASTILMRVLSADPNSTVLSEAIFQLGHIGRNPGNSVSQAIVGAFARQDALRPDDNLAFASLMALGKLAKFNRGINDATVFDMIARIQTENYSGPVKAEANRILGEIQKLG